MRYRGWSLILIFVCGVSYAYYARPATKAKGRSHAAGKKSPTKTSSSRDSATGSAAPSTVQSSKNAYYYQGQDDPQVAATVNGDRILTVALNQQTNLVLRSRRIPPDNQLTALESQRRFKNARWRLLQEMIRRLLLYQAARQAEQAGTIMIPSNRVPGYLTAMRKQFPTDDDLHRTYAHYLGTLEEYIKDSFREVELRRKLTGQLTITEAELHAYYRDHKEEFNLAGRLLSYDEAQNTNWVTRSLKRGKEQAIMERFMEDRRKVSTVTIFLSPSAM